MLVRLGEMRTRSPGYRADHARHRIVGAGLEPAPDGVLMRRTMGSTRTPHHARQRLALPGKRVGQRVPRG